MGWIFRLCSSNADTDVTKIVLEAAINQTINTESIQKALSIRGLLVNPDEQFLLASNKAKSDWKEVSFRLSWYFEINLNDTSFTSPSITVVYYVNSYVNSKYWILCYFQLLALKRTALLNRQETTLEIVFAGNLIEQKQFSINIRKLFPNYTNVTISYTQDNAYEYPGICKVKEVSEKEPNGYVLYFHPKGLSYLKLSWLKRHRLQAERIVFKHVVECWKQNIEILHHVRSVNKLGIQTGGKGWVWYNFWWSRCSYINELEYPVKTKDRYYYESWLVRKKTPDNLCSEMVPIECVPDCMGDTFSTFSSLKYGASNLGYIYHPNTFEQRLAFRGLKKSFLNRVKFYFKRTH